MKDWESDDSLRLYVVTTRLHGVSHVRNMKIDHTLMTALVKRWRHETHKCHIPVGEATITLEDITILLGLRIDGRSVTSHLTHN